MGRRREKDGQLGDDVTYFITESSYLQTRLKTKSNFSHHVSHSDLMELKGSERGIELREGRKMTMIKYVD